MAMRHVAMPRTMQTGNSSAGALGRAPGGYARGHGSPGVSPSASASCGSARTASRGYGESRSPSGGAGVTRRATASSAGGPVWASNAAKPHSPTACARGSSARNLSNGLSTSTRAMASRQTSQSAPNTPASTNRRCTPVERSVYPQSQGFSSHQRLQAHAPQHLHHGYPSGMTATEKAQRPLSSPAPATSGYAATSSAPWPVVSLAGTSSRRVLGSPETLTSSARSPGARRVGPSMPMQTVATAAHLRLPAHRAADGPDRGHARSGGALRPKRGVSATTAAVPARSPSKSSPELEADRRAPVLDESSAAVRADRGDTAPVLSQFPSGPPANAVLNFFRKAWQAKGIAAKFDVARMDVSLYWEKRRVQSALRRLLEAVQERFGMDGDVQAGALDEVFDALMAKVRRHPEDDKLDCQQFSHALDTFKLWPPDLSINEREEIFTAMVVPSASSARAVLGGQPLPGTVTRIAFKEGFDQLPFNLPDYPVPIHLLAPHLQPGAEKFTQDQIRAVAEAVATTFCMEQTGLGRTKDVFLTGLLSLEEIQRALPRLLPHGLVQDAVVQIIRSGGPLFSPEDWQDLVFSVRTKEACGHAPEAAETLADESELLATPLSTSEQVSMVSLGSPIMQSRDLTNIGATRVDGGPDLLQSLSNFGACAPESSVGEAPDLEALSRGRGREPATEPLPCRAVRSEEFVWFGHRGNTAVDTASNGAGGATKTSAVGAVGPQSPSTAKARVIDWSTASHVNGASGSAFGSPSLSSRAIIPELEESTSTRDTWGTSGFKQEVVKAFSKDTAVAGCGDEGETGSPDALAWINLELHSECGGPYLARAFLRCCQLYEKRRLKKNKSL